MLNSTVTVVVPATLTLLSQQIWREEHFAGDLMLLGFQLDVELLELLCLHDLVDCCDNAFKTLPGVGDLVFL